jgi:predicted nuclease of predicted toxin-antitoxin system
MRFLADMGISIKTVQWLRNNGHEALHLREQGLHRMADDMILEKARTEARILLTMDLDFGYLLAVSKEKLPSVIIFRLSDECSENVNEKLNNVLKLCGEDLSSGAVIAVGDKTMRARHLPI